MKLGASKSFSFDELVLVRSGTRFQRYGLAAGCVQGSADHALAVALNVELQPAMYVQSAPAFVVPSLCCEGCPSWVRSYLSHVVEGGAGGS